jgi:hypothetical protein
MRDPPRPKPQQVSEVLHEKGIHDKLARLPQALGLDELVWLELIKGRLPPL